VTPDRAILDVPRELIWFVAGLLRANRRALGTRKGARLLTCYRQALYGLACFRKKKDIPTLGRGFGLSQATFYRYLNEMIDVLAEQAPDLHAALDRAEAEGVTHLILDGKIVDTDRLHVKTISKKGKEIDRWYAGKTHDFGGNIQAVMSPQGIPLWVSAVLPGNVHDLEAARQQVLDIIRPYAKEMPVLADPGYEGAGHGILTPVKKPKNGRDLDVDTRTYNATRPSRLLADPTHQRSARKPRQLKTASPDRPEDHSTCVTTTQRPRHLEGMLSKNTCPGPPATAPPDTGRTLPPSRRSGTSPAEAAKQGEPATRPPVAIEPLLLKPRGRPAERRRSRDARPAAEQTRMVGTHRRWHPESSNT